MAPKGVQGTKPESSLPQSVLIPILLSNSIFKSCSPSTSFADPIPFNASSMSRLYSFGRGS
jgi:hypothetical protein